MNQRTSETRVEMYKRFKHAIDIPSSRYSRLAVNLVDYGFGCSVKLHESKDAQLVSKNIEKSQLIKEFNIVTKMNPDNSLLFQLHRKPVVMLNPVENKTIEKYDPEAKKRERNESRRYFRSLVNNILQLNTSEYSICDVYPSYDNWIVVYYRYTSNNFDQIHNKINNSVLSGSVTVTTVDDKLQLSIPNSFYQQLQKQPNFTKTEVKTIVKPTIQHALKSTGVPKVKESIQIDTSNFIELLTKSMASGQIDSNKFMASSTEIFNVLNNCASIDDTIKLAQLMGKKVQIELV
jgi:hypothetical protein